MKKLIISIDSYKIRYYHPLKESRNDSKNNYHKFKIIIQNRVGFPAKLETIEEWGNFLD